MPIATKIHTQYCTLTDIWDAVAVHCKCSTSSVSRLCRWCVSPCWQVHLHCSTWARACSADNGRRKPPHFQINNPLFRKCLVVGWWHVKGNCAFVTHCWWRCFYLCNYEYIFICMCTRIIVVQISVWVSCFQHCICVHFKLCLKFGLLYRNSGSDYLTSNRY